MFPSPKIVLFTEFMVTTVRSNLSEYKKAREFLTERFDSLTPLPREETIQIAFNKQRDDRNNWVFAVLVAKKSDIAAITQSDRSPILRVLAQREDGHNVTLYERFQFSEWFRNLFGSPIPAIVCFVAGCLIGVNLYTSRHQTHLEQQIELQSIEIRNLRRIQTSYDEIVSLAPALPLARHQQLQNLIDSEDSFYSIHSSPAGVQIGYAPASEGEQE